MSKVGALLLRPSSATVHNGGNAHQNGNNKLPVLNGLTPRHHVASSPALMELTTLSNTMSNRRHSSLAPLVEDGASLGEIFKMITQMRICVVRRAGSDVDQQISSVIGSACRAVVTNGNNSLEAPSSAVAHFLTVNQQSAGRMLDCVHRQGLPLIFLNGDCVGGLAELKRLVKSGFLAESLCPHNFELIVIGCGAGNAVAERAVEEAVKLGKRVALVEVIRTTAQNGRNTTTTTLSSDGRIAKEIVNHAALMRNAIEEARTNGWTVECEEGGTVSFWLDWRCVREGIARRERLKRERVDKIFEEGKVKRFTVLACQFSGTHELTMCADKDSEHFQADALLKKSADKFLLVSKSEPKMLENVPGAREFCISNEELFSLEHNPGRTLFFCDNDSDPALLESAAILKALGNDVMVMSHNYCGKKVGAHSFDLELIQSAKDKLRQRGVRFVVSVPTKFELLRAPTEEKAPILRVYAMSGSGTAEKGTGDWTPFLEEFNTVVISIGRRSRLAQELSLDKIGVRTNPATTTTTMQQNDNARKCSSEPLLAPNLYVVGDELDGGGGGATHPSAESDEANCLAAQLLLRRMYGGQISMMDQNYPIRTLLMPPNEYSCCGLSEWEAERKFGKGLLTVYRDDDVPIAAGTESAKMICLREGHQERVIGLHLIGPRASHLLQGYALTMQSELYKWQMEQNCQKQKWLD